MWLIPLGDLTLEEIAAAHSNDCMVIKLPYERIWYYTKLIKDYEEFLPRPHDERFYKVVLLVINRTNEQHVKWLIKDAKEQLGLDKN
jgi:hypothetical protein